MKSNKFLNQRGIGLPEVVIAMGLLVTFGVLISRMPGVRKISKRIVSSEQCINRASEVISAFSTNSNKMRVSNWHPNGANTVPPAFSFGGNRVPPGLSVDTNPWVLIDASYNWLAQYYNTTPAVCSANGPGMEINSTMPFFFSNPFVISTQSQLASERIFLNVQRYNIDNHGTDCVIPAIMVPSNAANAGVLAPIALKVSTTISYISSDGINRTCTAEALLKPDSDNTPPNPLNPATIAADLVLNPAPGACDIAAPAGAPTSCVCSNNICMTLGCAAAGPMGCAPHGGPSTVTIGYNAYQENIVKPFSMNQITGLPAVCANIGNRRETLNFVQISSEPGTIYTCSMNSAAENAPVPGPGGAFQSCNIFQKPGPVVPTRGVVTKIEPESTNPGSKTGVKVTLTDVPIGKHTVTLRATDTAANTSISSIDFAVLEPCPAVWTDSICINTTGPDRCFNPGVCPGTKVPICPPRESAPCGTPLVSDCGTPCPAGNGPPTTETLDPSFTGFDSSAATCNHCTIRGTCSDSAGPPPVVCDVRNCGAPVIAANCAATGIPCPALQAKGAGDPAFGNSYTQSSGGIGQFQFTGNLAGCESINYENAVNPATGQNYGNVPITPVPNGAQTSTQPFNFAYGPGVYSGNRTVTITCGGVPKSFSYSANCSGLNCVLTCNGCFTPP